MGGLVVVVRGGGVLGVVGYEIHVSLGGGSKGGGVSGCHSIDLLPKLSLLY